jgi:hypothetical protein
MMTLMNNRKDDGICGTGDRHELKTHVYRILVGETGGLRKCLKCEYKLNYFEWSEMDGYGVD